MGTQLRKRQVNVYIDRYIWKEFQKYVLDIESSASVELERYMKKVIDEHGKGRESNID